MYNSTCQPCSIEKILSWGKICIAKYKFSFIASLVTGLLTYVFAFTNKLINHDEVTGLFVKGSGLSSGRWALDFMHYLFPNYSMPWIYGVISVLLIAFSSCIIISVFEIKNKLLQMLLSGCIMAFPSLIGTFSYMFASTSYTFSFLLAVLAFYLFTKNKWMYKIFGMIALTISIGIYQSYVSVTASLMLLFLLKELFYSDRPFAKIFKDALFFLLELVISLATYYLITLLLLHITGTEMNSYATASSENSIFENIFSAYSGFLNIFMIRKYSLITTMTSKFMHLLMLLFSGIVALFVWIKLDVLKKIFSIVVALLLPASINCMCLLSKEDSVHTLVLYSFIAVYVLFVMLIDNIEFGNIHSSWKRLYFVTSKEIVTWCMAIVLITNIYIGNAVYLRMYLCYENMYGYYSSVMTLAKSTPGFDSSSKVALVGLAGNTLHFHTEFDSLSTDITGTQGINVNSYSREDFIRRYIGTEIPFANKYEIEEIKKTDEYSEMPIYPYYGSIKKIGDYVVVKFE